MRRYTWTPTVLHQTQSDSSRTISTPSTESDLSDNEQQPNPIPAAQPEPILHMPLPSDFPFFSGDESDLEKPGSWLKRLERNWTPTTTDAQKVLDFSTSLDADSIAETWWDKLDAANKATWADVKAAFKLEWPPGRTQDVSASTKRDIMMSHRVTEEDLGKMEGEGRRKDYTHTIWADKVELLWKQLDDRNGLLIPEVRSNLPQSLTDCLPEMADMHRDFKIFLQAVRDVPVEKVLRRTAELRRLHELEQQVSSLSQPSWSPPSPVSRMTQKFSTTSLTNPTYTHQSSYSRPTFISSQPKTAGTNNTPVQPAATANPSTPYIPPFCRQTPPHSIRQQATPANSDTNPFDNNTTPRPNNSFYQRIQQQQASPLAHKSGNSHQLAQSAAQQSRLYPDTETGHSHYSRDVTAWETAFGKDSQMIFSKDPLLLMPGSSPLGSQECYQCGKATNPLHIGADCPSTIRIPQRESSWRNYINKILYPVGQRGNVPRTFQTRDNAMIAPIYAMEGEYLEYDPYLYPIDTVTFRNEQHSENGQESRE